VPIKDPEKRREYMREYQRARRAGEQRPALALLPSNIRARTAEQIVDVMEGQILAVLGDKELGTVERAKTIGYLSSIQLRAIETAQLAARVEALERALKERKG